MNYIHEKFCPSCQEWLSVKAFPRFRDSKIVCLSCQRCNEKCQRRGK